MQEELNHPEMNLQKGLYPNNKNTSDKTGDFHVGQGDGAYPILFQTFCKD